MKNIVKTGLMGLALVSALAFGAAADSMAQSLSEGIKGGVNVSQGKDVPTELTDGDDSVFKTVVNIMLFVIGAVSVIMLIFGGIRYTTSAGNSNAVTSAKNTIMYAIIGLIIAIFAYAIVNWVVSSTV